MNFNRKKLSPVYLFRKLLSKVKCYSNSHDWIYPEEEIEEEQLFEYSFVFDYRICSRCPCEQETLFRSDNMEKARWVTSKGPTLENAPK